MNEWFECEKKYLNMNEDHKICMKWTLWFNIKVNIIWIKYKYNVNGMNEMKYECEWAWKWVMSMNETRMKVIWLKDDLSLNACLKDMKECFHVDRKSGANI